MNYTLHMNVLRNCLYLALVLATTPLFAQADDDILFTVGDDEVTVGEFKYIYSKSNGEEADFSKASVQEYLDLYQRFKLKVARARAMGLDTVQLLQDELTGYRQQLTDNYIIDRQVTDKLVAELYERQQKDVDFSHIFLPFDGNPTPEDTLALYQEAVSLKASVTPANFAAKAGEVSKDAYSAERGGRIGFVSAPFPRGLDRLETALYTAPAGEVVGPVQTTNGYHLAIKHAERPAYGEIEVGHILIRKPKGAPLGEVPPASIQTAKAQIESGEDFAKVAGEYSEDTQTKDNAGYLGFFGINVYDPAFEKAAFALTEDGQVSDIIETKAGFHLIRRISRRRVTSLDEIRPLLETKVKSDDRFARAKRDLLQQLRVQSELTVREDALEGYLSGLDGTQFASARWQPTEVEGENKLLWTTENGRQGTVADFQQYLLRNNRQRIALARGPGATAATAARKLFDGWLDEELFKYAESRLEQDYPEFAALMREYREGILLFEATKMEVWDKASEDSTGLLAFYEKNREEYQWGERATVSAYTIDTKTDVDVNSVVTFAGSHGPEEVIKKFGEERVQVATDDYELDRLEEMELLQPTVGSTSMLKNDLRKGVATFYRVDALLPPAPKQLDEARGYVIADYQDELERQWVERLRGEYDVKVNKRVLNKIIQ